MKGTVLGFDATSQNGAIRGEDGARYALIGAEWKGAHPPRPGAEVDFEAEGKDAKDAYPIGGGGVLAGALAGSTSIDAEAALASGKQAVANLKSSNIAQLMLRRPAILFAVLTLFGCTRRLLAGWDASLFDVHDLIEQARQGIRGIGMLTQGGVDESGLLVYYLLYLIPVFAAWVLWSEYKNRDAGGSSVFLRLIAGFIALTFLVLVPVGAGLIIFLQMPPEVQRMAEGMGRSMFDLVQQTPGATPNLGTGAILIIGSGLLMLLNVFGIIRSFGKRD